MFHRVKSEASKSEQDTQTTQNADHNSQASTGAPENAVSASDNNESKSTSSNTPNNSAEKDTTSMNTTSDNQTETQGPESSQSQDAAPARVQTPAAYQQRPMQSPVSSPRQFGSSIPAASYSYSSDSASSSEVEQRRLIIGHGITMSGEIEHCDHLVVEGTVEAALKGASAMDIAKSGTFYGTVDIEEATVAGRFEGDLTVSGRLTVRSGGVITGTIAYGELEIEAGAVIDGRLTPVAAMQQAAKNESAPAPRSSAPASKKEQQPEPANSDGSLFSEKATAAAE